MRFTGIVCCLVLLSSCSGGGDSFTVGAAGPWKEAYSAENPDPDVQRFVRAFEEKYHAKPDAFAALAYDATRLVAEAISKKGNSRKGVREYLSSLTAATAFDGVTGPVYFNKNGDPVGMGFHVAQVIDGALTSSGTRVVATTTPGIPLREHP